MFDPKTGIYNDGSALSPAQVQHILNDSLIALVKKFPGGMAALSVDEIDAVAGDRMDMRFNAASKKLELYVMPKNPGMFKKG